MFSFFYCANLTGEQKNHCDSVPSIEYLYIVYSLYTATIKQFIIDDLHPTYVTYT